MNPQFPPSPRRIIGISGKQYAGKDVLADLLLQALPGFRKVPIARAIKAAYAKGQGLTVEAVETEKARHRPGLIALGDWGRAQDPDYWLKQVLDEPGNLLISDVRLKREHDLLRRAGAFLIRVEADRTIRAGRGHLVSEDDPTECDLDDIRDWDAVITNNGDVAALKAQIDTIAQNLLSS